MPAIMNCGLSQVNIPSILISNGLGACLMLAILFSKHRRVRSITYDGRMYFWMCFLCLALCVTETIGFLLDGRCFSGARQLITAVNVLIYFFSVPLAFLWICYVDYKLFGQHARLKHLCVLLSIPAGIILLMAGANLFAPVFFYLDSENVYRRTPLFLLPYAVTYVYLTYGAVLACLYRNRVNKYLFLPVLSFVIPVYIGSMIQLLYYGLALIWPTTALGLTFLYINLQNEETFLDALTSLYNRNYLLHYINRLTRQAKKGSRTIGILLDVNGFKHINDSFGHLQGDQVLRAVGNILIRAAGQAAVFRYGGDEFMILLENAQPGQAAELLRHIDTELRRYNASGQLPYPISFSSGVAEFDSADVFAFLQEMDRNMYSHKRSFYSNTQS